MQPQGIKNRERGDKGIKGRLLEERRVRQKEQVIVREKKIWRAKQSMDN